MAIHYQCNNVTIQDALRSVSKDVLLYMITEQEDNHNNESAPRGFIRLNDGHLSPDFSTSDYLKALESLELYVLHASYVIDAWRGKPKGSAMEVIYEGMKVQEYQYEALAYVAKALANTIKVNGLLVDYHMPDPASPEWGNGDPDFNEVGWAAAASTLKALELSIESDPHTVSILEAATND